MPEILAIAGLVIATVLYALLVRRRSLVRSGIESMSRALSASNEIAMARLRSGFGATQSDPAAAVERRSGTDRRKANDRRRGRGRRRGGDRRRGRSPV
jgi:hypothetical protein